MSVIGVDVDGVLANFFSAYEELFVKITGEDRFPMRYPYLPQTWNWPESYGYTREQVSEVWREIREDKAFWYKLPPLPGALEFLADLDDSSHEVYFITDRPGYMPQVQTQLWLQEKGYSCPSVLISRRGKGVLAQGLSLDYYIDDKSENVLDCLVKAEDTKTYLLRYPYNEGVSDESMEGRVVRNLEEFWGVISE